MAVPSLLPLRAGHATRYRVLSDSISHGEAMKGARRADDLGPAGKAAREPNGAVRYASRLPRDYKREKPGPHGKRA